MVNSNQCCLCGNPITADFPSMWDGGHNPWPLVDDCDHRCCGRCNGEFVMKARLFAYASSPDELDDYCEELRQEAANLGYIERSNLPAVL